MATFGACMALSGCLGSDGGAEEWREGGPLQEIYNEYLSQTCMSTDVGEEVSFGFGAMFNPTSDEIVIDHVELGENSGFEYLGAWALGPAYAVREEADGALGTHSGFPPKDKREYWHEGRPFENVTLHPKGRGTERGPNADRNAEWLPAVGVSRLDEAAASKGVRVYYHHRGRQYVATAPLILLAAEECVTRFSESDSAAMFEMWDEPLSEWSPILNGD